jgi:hypothetical protein
MKINNATITSPTFFDKRYKIEWRGNTKFFLEPDEEFTTFRNNPPLAFMLEYLHSQVDGSNYGQRFLCMEEGSDGKLHFKFTVHRSRTSLVSSWVTLVQKAITEFLYPNEVEIRKNLALDFYVIGNWDEHGYWSEETGMVYPYMNTKAFKKLHS